MKRKIWCFTADILGDKTFTDDGLGQDYPQNKLYGKYLRLLSRILTWDCPLRRIAFPDGITPIPKRSRTSLSPDWCFWERGWNDPILFLTWKAPVRARQSLLSVWGNNNLLQLPRGGQSRPLWKISIDQSFGKILVWTSESRVQLLFQRHSYPPRILGSMKQHYSSEKIGRVVKWLSISSQWLMGSAFTEQRSSSSCTSFKIGNRLLRSDRTCFWHIPFIIRSCSFGTVSWSTSRLATLSPLSEQHGDKSWTLLINLASFSSETSNLVCRLNNNGKCDLMASIGTLGNGNHCGHQTSQWLLDFLGSPLQQ